MGSPGSDPLDQQAILILLHFDCSQETELQHQSTIRPLAASLDLLFNLLVHYYTWDNQKHLMVCIGRIFNQAEIDIVIISVSLLGSADTIFNQILTPPPPFGQRPDFVTLFWHPSLKSRMFLLQLPWVLNHH